MTPETVQELYIAQEHPRLSLSEEQIRCAVEEVFRGEEASYTSLGIILSGHEHIRELNRQFRGKNYMTDVLAFPLHNEGEPVEGEVYVDLDTAWERAPEFHASFEEEALRYIIHGVLHLIGHLDDTPEGKAQMHALEDRYLTHMRQRGCLGENR